MPYRHRVIVVIAALLLLGATLAVPRPSQQVAWVTCGTADTPPCP